MRRAFVACILVVGGCSTKPNDADTGAPPDDAAVHDETSLSVGDAGDAGDPMLTCSGDLRNVVTSGGGVVMECPPDQGCAGGMCVPACIAAAASKGSIGCDYQVATPSFWSWAKPPCFAVFIANGWPMDAKLTVSRDGNTYDVTSFGRLAQAGVPETQWAAVPSNGVPTGKVAVLFLSHDPQSVNYGPLTCPIPPALSQPYGTAIISSGSAVDVTGRGHAWHIQSSYPITAYDILPYGGAKSLLPSAELLFPTTAWGTNYYGIVAMRGSGAPQWGQLVATQNGTIVTVFPNVSLPGGTNGGTVAAAPANKQTQFNLAAGEYIQWQESNEMSGTIIQSNNPIAFTGGLGYDCYKSATSPDGGGCDSAHQQIPPVSAFGSHYVAMPYTTRLASLQDESIVYRIVAAVKGTQFTYSPAVAGAPTMIAAGQPVDFEAVGGFVVTSQDSLHPFYLGQIMPGCHLTGGSRAPGGCLGDEEYVNLLPPAQFLSKYVFFTDPTYATTNLVFARVKMNGSFKDVTLDCLGTLSGWTSVGAYEITNVDLIRGGMKNGACDNGPHTASSDAPFGLMVWGIDEYASYAYPAGGNIATINPVIVPPMNPN